MGGKLKAAGVILLIGLAVGAGWALWMGLKLLATIAGVGLVIGLAVGVATSGWFGRRKLEGPGERSRLS